MKIKITQNWNQYHWADYELELNDQQQQQVAQLLKENPEADEQELLDGLGIDISDVINSTEPTDEGFKSNDNYIELESDIHDTVEAA
jgi:hypothetical protein